MVFVVEGSGTGREALVVGKKIRAVVVLMDFSKDGWGVGAEVKVVVNLEQDVLEPHNNTHALRKRDVFGVEGTGGNLTLELRFPDQGTTAKMDDVSSA